MAMETERKRQLVGRLFKKRGGLGRHAKHPWQPRTFTLTVDGVLSYFDSDILEKPRQCLNLPRVAAFLVSSDESPEDAPTDFMMIVCHTQGQRWKLCAETAEHLELWREEIEKHCYGKNSISRPHNYVLLGRSASVPDGCTTPCTRTRSRKLELKISQSFLNTYGQIAAERMTSYRKGLNLMDTGTIVFPFLFILIDLAALLIMCVSWALASAVPFFVRILFYGPRNELSAFIGFDVIEPLCLREHYSILR
jgi:hypothetical protein